MARKSISKDKKGDTGNMMFMIIAVLAIITIVILGSFLNSLYVKIRDSNEMKNCQASIAAHAFVASGTKGEIYTDVKCPTRIVRLDPDDKNVNGKIAEDMHRCWYEWGKGKLQLFEGEGIFCHICSIYQFEEYDKKVTGLMEYIATQKIKVKYAGDIPGITYMDYFQGYDTPHSKEYFDNADKQKISEMYKEDYIDTNHKYATIFVYASGKDSITTFLEGGGRTTLTAVGGVTILLGVSAGVTGVLAAVGMVNVWNPIGWAILGAGGIILGVTAIYTAVFGGDDPQWMSTIVFRNYDNESLSGLGCQFIETNQLTKTVK